MFKFLYTGVLGINQLSTTVSFEDCLTHIKSVLLSGHHSNDISTVIPFTISMFDAKKQYKLLGRCCEIIITPKTAQFADPKVALWLLDPSCKEMNLQSIVSNYCPSLTGLLQGNSYMIYYNSFLWPRKAGGRYFLPRDVFFYLFFLSKTRQNCHICSKYCCEYSTVSICYEYRTVSTFLEIVLRLQVMLVWLSNVELSFMVLPNDRPIYFVSDKNRPNIVASNLISLINIFH